MCYLEDRSILEKKKVKKIDFFSFGIETLDFFIFKRTFLPKFYHGVFCVR